MTKAASKTAKRSVSKKKKAAPARKRAKAPARTTRSKTSRPGKGGGLLDGLKAILAKTPAGKILAALVGVVAVAVVGVHTAKRFHDAGSAPAERRAEGSAGLGQPVAAVPAEAGRLGELFGQVRGQGFAARMAFWSDAIIKDPAEARELLRGIAGAPTIEDSALLVPERFDCTTFVETVSSLARSRSSRDFFDNLVSIRYKNRKATFIGRNHFPEADWIPNNTSAGLLRDVTAEVASAAGVAAASQSKEIRRAEWLEKELRAGRVNRAIASVTDPDWAKPVDAKVDYLPIAEMKKFIPHLPHGAVLNIVRKADPSRPVMITHQGIVVHKGKMVFLRHSLPSGELRTVRLVEYLSTLTKKGPANWPIVGVNVNRINDAG